MGTRRLQKAFSRSRNAQQPQRFRLWASHQPALQARLQTRLLTRGPHPRRLQRACQVVARRPRIPRQHSSLRACSSVVAAQRRVQAVSWGWRDARPTTTGCCVPSPKSVNTTWHAANALVTSMWCNGDLRNQPRSVTIVASFGKAIGTAEDRAVRATGGDAGRRSCARTATPTSVLPSPPG